MFSDILDFFDDFPKVSVSLYGSQTEYDPDTGETTEQYTLNETLSAWGFQKSAVQNYIRDKVFEDVDKVFVFEQLPTFSDLLYHDELWYKLAWPDNVGFANGAYIVGAIRTEKPNILSDEPRVFNILGDVNGVLG